MAKDNKSEYVNPTSVMGAAPPPPAIFTEGLAKQLADERDPKKQKSK